MKLFVNNLTNVDFSYLHPQRGLLGETWLVQLVLDGQLDEQGMICDFGIVKKRVKQWMDDTIDHALVVPTGMPRLSWQQAAGKTEVNWLYPQGEVLRCNAPDQAIVLAGIPEVTEQTLATWCTDQLLKLFPGVTGLEIRFVPEQIEGAFYHYSHGLQQHDGNCQRIAHGHRSMIEIYLDDERCTPLETQWAQRWQDIYLGTRDHLVSQNDDQHMYRYTAPQGEFELELPARACYLMETETTVEQIAMHLAGEIKKTQPAETQVRVHAYEGYGKGAIACA